MNLDYRGVVVARVREHEGQQDSVGGEGIVRLDRSGGGKGSLSWVTAYLLYNGSATYVSQRA